MKIVRESINEIRRSESAMSSVGVGYSGMIRNIIMETARMKAVSFAYKRSVVKGDVAYDLHRVIADNLVSNSLEILDIVPYGWITDEKENCNRAFWKLMSFTDGSMYETKMGKNTYCIKFGKYFALTWDKDYMIVESPKTFYVFVDNRKIHLG